MKKNSLYCYLLIFVFLGTKISFAQTPTSCFEISSILVDACGTPEGANEMVLIHIGPSDLNTANLSINWPNNPWRNICQNATTASTVTQMNAQIQGCGYLLEPTGGVLPAGERVLIITSTAFDPNSHDFAGLNDTLYVIFQCSGNTAGHFANSTSSGIRTLSIGFSAPSGCTDTVEYNTQLLVDTAGNPGGSSVAARNGSTVEYTWDGTPTYTNDGCNAPYAQLNPNAGNTLSICQSAGNTITLNGTVSAGNYPYQWFGGTGSFSVDTILNPVYTLGAGDTNTFELYLREYSSCDTVTDTLQVTVNPPPAVNLGADTAICAGESLALSAGNPGATFNWSTNETSQSISVNTAGQYWVEVSSGPGCINSDTINVTLNPLPAIGLNSPQTLCPGDSVLLDAGNSGASYSWSSGETTQQIYVNTLGWTYVTVTDANNCENIDSTNLIAGPIPTATLGADIRLCPGSAVTLDPQYTGGSYLWSTNATSQSISVTQPGNYWVQVGTVCDTVGDSINITVYPIATVDAGNPSDICPGDTFFTNTAVASQGNIRWSGGAGFFIDPTDISTGYVPANGETGTIMLYLDVSDSCSSYQDSLPLTITPPLSGNITSNDSVCPGDSFLLRYSGNATSVLWMGAGAFGYIDSSSTSYIPSTGAQGTISIQLMTANNCESLLDTLNLFIADNPVAAFDWAPDELQAGTEIRFQNQSTVFITQNQWEFGDGNTSSASSPIHSYEESGNFIVSLIVTNEAGCQDTVSQTLEVDEGFVLIPNVFSPNGDEINDHFLIVMPPVIEYEIRIFDRWGAEIYYSNSLERPWDGSYKEKSAPEGVYFYRVNARLNNGDAIRKAGSVTLFR